MAPWPTRFALSCSSCGCGWLELGGSVRAVPPARRRPRQCHTITQPAAEKNSKINLRTPRRALARARGTPPSMRGSLLVALAAAAAAAAAPCRATASDGSIAPKCEAWCAVEDKQSDCSFCACSACSFCAVGGGGAGHHAAASHKPATDWRIPAEACSLGGRARLAEKWNGGFRFEVIPERWVSGVPFTLDWGGAAVRVRTAYSADVTSQSAGTSVLTLQARWNEHHGFSFNADGDYVPPTL
eukprot:scaffold532_cov99-Isochrysis_galbana.AAC.1